MRERVGLFGVVLGFFAVSGLAATFDLPGDKPESEIAVMLQLEDRPAVEVYSEVLGAPPARASAKAMASATGAARDQIALIESRQLAVAAELESRLGAEVLFRVQRVYNGIGVRIDRDRYAEVSSLPGVRSVHPLRPPKLANSTSVPFIGAAVAWSHDPPATGAGVTVGIIDSGIDYIHKDFGGSGLSGDYDANDQETIDDGFFPTTKVIDGWDFFADDPDPFDRPGDTGGHGTHVAGTVAGYGLNEDGSTYTGPYDDTTPFGELGGGPGVAPEAKLVALRIFGDGEGSFALISAIEWAVDPNGDGDFSDHLDVINMSLGDIYGTLFSPEWGTACNNAALAGVIPVAAAGNSGDGFYITTNPGTADRAISAAASVDSSKLHFGVRIDAPSELAGDIVGMYQDFGGSFAQQVSAEVVETRPADACSELVNGAEISGRIALVSWTGCALGKKAKAIEAAGGLGVIVVPDGWPQMPLNAPSQEEVDITVVMVRESDGQRLRAALPGVEASLGFFPIEPGGADTIASFSSRGPRYPDSMLKPDVAAPGQAIWSAAAGNGSSFISLSGTSMSTPHVVGAMAVLRELHPEWSVEELKALIMNTAVDTFLGPGLEPPFNALSRVGAGRIDLGRAVESEVVVFATEPAGFVSASFGFVEVSGQVNRTRSVRVVNHSDLDMTFDIRYDGRAALAGAEVSLPQPAEITVPGGGSSEFKLGLIADSAVLEHACDPDAGGYSPVKSPDPSAGLPGGPQAMARPCPGEVAGYLELAPRTGDHPVLRLPVHAVLRAVATMGTASEQILVPGANAELRLESNGAPLDPGSSGPGHCSLCSSYELAETNPDDGNIEDDTYDLRFVGVASDRQARAEAGQHFDDTVISFAMATHGPWTHPNPIVFRVWVDNDRDGEWDYVVLNYPTLHWLSYADEPWAEWTDVTWSVVVDLASGAEQWQYPVNGALPDEFDVPVLNSDIMVLLARATDLGLVEGDSAFDYDVETVIPGFNLVVDRSAKHTFDPDRPGVRVREAGLAPGFLDDVDGAGMTVEYDRHHFLANESEGLLLIHHHNASGARAEAVEIVPVWPGPPVDEPSELE